MAKKHTSDVFLFVEIYCRPKLTFVPGIMISFYNHIKLLILEGPKAKNSSQIENAKVPILKYFICNCYDALRRSGKEISGKNYIYIAVEDICYF